MLLGGFVLVGFLFLCLVYILGDAKNETRANRRKTRSNKWKNHNL